MKSDPESSRGSCNGVVIQAVCTVCTWQQQVLNGVPHGHPQKA